MVGTKVICIDDNFSNVLSELQQQAKGLPLSFPKKDEEYIIRGIFDNDNSIGEPSYLLEAVYNPYFKIPLTGEFRELAFAHWRFRTLVYNTTVSEKEEELLITI